MTAPLSFAVKICFNEGEREVGFGSIEANLAIGIWHESWSQVHGVKAAPGSDQ
jgi:hypothetical protein